MRKLFSILFNIFLICAIAASVYFYPNFYRKQIDKVIAVYNVYKGDKAYKRLNLNRAISHYNKAVNLYPKHYGAWYNLGNIYVVYEDYFSAVDAYERAFEFNPKMIIARMNYGIVSAGKLGDFDGAIKQYDEIIKTKRHLVSIPFVYSNRRSYKFNKGLAYYNKGVTYRQKSIYSEEDSLQRHHYLMKALEAYKNACKILKNDYDARYNLALTQHLLGNYREAGLGYCSAIELAPLNYEAHYNLAILLRHLKYYKESKDELLKASTLVANSDNVARQRYIFDVMNDVTRTILIQQDNEMIEKLTDEPSDEFSKVTYVNGKLVLSDDMDAAIMKNFKVCGAKKIIKEDIDNGTDEFEDVRYNIHIPSEN